MGTVRYKVQVDNDLFEYNSKEIADMIERIIHQDTLRYCYNDSVITEQAFNLMKKGDEQMTKEELELVVQYSTRIRKIDDMIELLRKPMLIISSQMTGNTIRLNSLDNDTRWLLYTAMTEALETRKQELKEKLERL